MDLVDVKTLKLPKLEPSIYQEIAVDSATIDERGQKVLEILSKKYILPITERNLTLLKKFGNLVHSLDVSISGLANIPDAYRKQRALDKLENDILFQLNAVYKEEIKENYLPEHREALTTGVEWYSHKLKEQLDRYPQKLKVTMSKEDFEPHENDPLGLKVFKSFKRFKHKLFKSPFTHQIDYHRIAYIYQYQKRKFFFKRFLDRVLHEESTFYNGLRSLTGRLLDAIKEARKEPELDTYKKVSDALRRTLEETIETQHKVALMREGRLQLANRKNLQAMINEMERIDVKRDLRRKIRSKKVLQETERNIKSFPEKFFQQLEVQLNLSLIELSANSVKSRAITLEDEFTQELASIVHAKYIKPLDKMRSLFEAKELDNVDKKLKLNVDFEHEIYELFQALLDKMLKLTETMPETLEISTVADNDNQDAVTIPLARMTEYYLKSRYEVIVEQHFESFMDLLKQSIFTSRDLLSLAQFNLDNPEGSIASNREIWKNSLVKLEKERVRVETGLQDFTEFSRAQLHEVFEPISIFKIRQSADDFSIGLRSYQGQRVLTGLGKLSNEVSVAFRNILSSVLYSRSKGVIFTKQFTKPKNLSSSNSRLLDLVDHVSPSEQVIKALPPYYVALFNGKSNINHELWIPRAQDDNAFQKAVQRYRAGHLGGILVLGERNSGKTSFIKEALGRFLKGKQVYELFPPPGGTTSTEVFLDLLQKSTSKTGEVDQLFTLLPEGSVLVINDMELFWTRTQDGLSIIELVQQLIDDYSDKVLFIINMNPFAYKIINELTAFSDRFIENITLSHFSAEELKDLVMKRHRSSGLAVGLKEAEKSLSELQLARLFNSYFSYSDGMPGTALNGWLANIKKANKSALLVKKPELQSLSVFRDLHEDWIMLLAQFALHKRLSAENIARITGWSSDHVDRIILAMLRTGILVQKVSGVYYIQPYLCHFVVKSLKEQGIV